MDKDTVTMLQQMFCGQVVRHLSGGALGDSKSLGMHIKRMDYLENLDKMLMSVYYINLKAKESERYYSDRDTLLIGFEDFVNGFEYWTNQHTNTDIGKAEWIPLKEIVRIT